MIRHCQSQVFAQELCGYGKIAGDVQDPVQLPRVESHHNYAHLEVAARLDDGVQGSARLRSLEKKRAHTAWQQCEAGGGVRRVEQRRPAEHRHDPHETAEKS